MAFQNGWRGPNIVSDGLVLYLDAGSPNSYRPDFGTTWKDMSGFNNSGSLINGPTYSFANGGSIVFDGTNDYINCGTNNVLNLNNDYTISTWIKATSGVVVQRYFYGGSYPGYEINISRTTLGKVDLFTGGTWYNNIGNNINNLNWNNVVFTISSTSAIFYQNSSQTSFTVASSTSNLDDTLYIGATEGTTSFLSGNLSILQIYNRALSATEIQQNYNAQKSRFGL